MGKMFNPDSKISILLNRIADYVILGVIWIICSLPIFTIGASTTALYYTSLKLLDGEESYLTKDFFYSFKTNFKQATLLWLAALGVGIFLAFDLMLCRQMGNPVTYVVVISFALVYLLTLLYLFPYLSKFYCTFKQAIRSALFMSIQHIGYTIALIVINAVLIITAMVNPFLVILLPAVFTYLNSSIFRQIFKKYIPEKPQEAVVSVSESEENVF